MATENPESKRKVGGGKLARSETVTVRLDPKLRYLAELAARKQRRTLSSYIEWAVEESLSTVNLVEEDGDDQDSYHRALSVWGATDSLWDVDEADRFVKLATQFPDLMTYAEQAIWKIINEETYLFLPQPKGTQVLQRDLLRVIWEDLQAYANKEISKEAFHEQIRPIVDLHYATARYVLVKKAIEGRAING